MATHTFSFLQISPLVVQSNRHKPCISLRLNPLLGNQLLIGRLSSTHLVLKCHRSTTATVLANLQTSKEEKASQEKIPKWSAKAIKSLAMAELEARKLKYPNTGTDALLMGILSEGTSLAAKFLRTNRITLFKVREETINLLGKSDMYYFSPNRPPLTEQAQSAINWAVDEKLKSGASGELTPDHILLGIWAEKESAGHKIMESLGFDDEKAKELAKTMNEDIARS
ncbi:clp protease-related protein [Tripterygium wilfordii]|uniref:Clp protease-related protein n=1 Tax=Tripterygium wilfordii TaxID=458696 RepID=A0A7J7CDU9_TRIWF|nr:ATP-dependent Clp protease ATP-binding subunit CLPT1, chloroplastic [Tripterygium wilfordii]KAF5732308.1 clp protease-related protein [Tripterygium wilfordii]